MDRAVPPLRRLLAGALLLTGVGLGTLLLLQDDGNPGPPTPDKGYRITYELEDLVAGARTVEVVEVDRPLSSRRLSDRGGSATSVTGVYDRSSSVWRQVAVVPPGETGHDLRLARALSWSESQGLAHRDGTGTVAGRGCTWWLSKEPLDIAAVSPATEQDRARSCVDDAGLLLADTWRAGGTDLRRRTASRFEALEELDVLDGTVPEELPPALRLTVVETLDEPTADLAVLAPPAGLPLHTAARFVDLEPGTTDVARRSIRAVYADDSELLVVDQVRGSVEARGVSVPAGPLGTASVQATGGGLVAVVALGEEQFLRVRTSLAFDDLMAWLRSLRRS